MIVGELKTFLSKFPDEVPVSALCKAVRRAEGEYLWVVAASGAFAVWSKEGTESYPALHLQLLKSSDPHGRVILPEVLTQLKSIDQDETQS